MTAQTIAGPSEYWEQYYGCEFIFGLGTEQILAALRQVPPTGTWIDIGAGSESLLWSIALETHRLIAIDRDEQRLRILRAYADACQPRAAYRTTLVLCDRTPGDFIARCESLSATLSADCLNGSSLPLRPCSAGLVTQFGLLGLTSSPGQFARAWAACHEPLVPGGWAAGANWTAIRQPGRVRLTPAALSGRLRSVRHDAAAHPAGTGQRRP
ncbi:MAG TPA: hypothetical protein VHZ03_45930 [Trebonia sp.]|nr:hypothetical protein [Trebonia sp.]